MSSSDPNKSESVEGSVESSYGVTWEASSEVFLEHVRERLDLMRSRATDWRELVDMFWDFEEAGYALAGIENGGFVLVRIPYTDDRKVAERVVKREARRIKRKR